MLTYSALLVASALLLVRAPPPAPSPAPSHMAMGGGGGMSTSGEVTATGMCNAATSCAVDGSSNYILRNLAYNTNTGIFSGSIITNLCPGHASMFQGSVLQLQNTPTCVNQSFPAPAYVTTPAAAAIIGRTGLSIKYGSNIYGPMEAGFSLGQACDNSVGECANGLDLTTCVYILEQQCGTAHVQYGMMMDDCNGHASPYHYHADPSCEYTNAAGHSPITGVMLDGRGLYGLYETTNTPPTDLDACNGHYGPVPARTIGTDTYPAATNVYHYHATAEAPYTAGCFGPVASIAAAKTLYATCNDGDSTTYCTSHGKATIDLKCPIYGDSANPWSPYAFTADCVNTSLPASPSTSASPSRSASPTVSPSKSVSPPSSPSGLASVSSTGASTPTSTSTPSSSLSVGATPSSTPSITATPSSTQSMAATPSSSQTMGATLSSTASTGSSPSSTQTRAATPSSSPPLSATPSSSPSHGGSPPPGGSLAPSHPGMNMGGGSMLVSGEETATGQCNAASTCAMDGSSNYVMRDLDYDTNTGIFTGHIITNLCPGHPSIFNGTQLMLQNTPSCVNQTFPAPAYVTTPAPAAIIGRTGLSLKYGTNIFGPMEAGFTLGQACDINAGLCASGLDLHTCMYILEQQCGTAHVRYSMMMDDCGGHASPYHYHANPSCEYTQGAGHSPITGVMLDGRGLYGLYETTNTLPTDLDACNGHYGPVPARTIGTDTYPAATHVYHYHATAEAPYTAGCFGPVASIAAAKNLYTTCNDGDSTTYCTSHGKATIDLKCPIYGDSAHPWSPYEVTSDCNGTNTISPNSNLESSALPQATAIGVGVGVSIGGLILISLLFVWWNMSSKKTSANRKLTRHVVPSPLAHADV